MVWVSKGPEELHAVNLGTSKDMLNCMLSQQSRLSGLYKLNARSNSSQQIHKLMLIHWADRSFSTIVCKTTYSIHETFSSWKHNQVGKKARLTQNCWDFQRQLHSYKYSGHCYLIIALLKVLFWNLLTLSFSLVPCYSFRNIQRQKTHTSCKTCRRQCRPSLHPENIA